MLVLCNFLRKLMVSDKKIHRAELIQLYKQNPLEKFLIFTIYQNYTLALSLFLNFYKRKTDNLGWFTVDLQHEFVICSIIRF